MTENQEKLYWRLWGRVCHANDWRWAKGRILPTAERDTSEHHQAVWSLAGSIAAQHHRAVTADDLRHACHVHATGRDKTHMDLDKKAEVSRLFTLFKLLIEPNDLDAVMDWENPERDQRRRYVSLIKKYPFAAVDKIARARFKGDYHSPFFEDLQLWQLKQLTITLVEWRRGWNKRAERLDPENAPF